MSAYCFGPSSGENTRMLCPCKLGKDAVLWNVGAAYL